MASAMQFWGVEVKAKQTHSESLILGSIIHVSQVTLGEIKKDKETVTVHVKVGDKKLVMGLLSQETPQLSCDLVFDGDVEFSHNWKNGSIHLMGYKADTSEQSIDYGSSDEEEEDIVPVAKENGLISVPKPKVENKPKPDLDEDDSSDDDDFEEGDSDEDMGDTEEDDDESEDSEEETPVVVAPLSKKRGNSAAKTPEPKKAKIIATPSKTETKKGAALPATPHPKKEVKTPAGNKSESKGAAHTATPHPKKGGSTPAAEKSPKSAGDVACSSCKKTFKSDVGLQAHTKAKHGAAN